MFFTFDCLDEELARWRPDD
jgi:hypothetical protein